VLVRLFIAAALIVATVAIQAIFMSASGFASSVVWRRGIQDYLRRNATLVTVVWIIYLLVPVMLDVALWALFFTIFGVLPSFEEAAYFSTVTFTTVGYGDIVLGKEWRQVAVFEAVNGWIIFGWATALMMAVIQRLYFRCRRPTASIALTGASRPKCATV
jgi:voltage-gated potassium channel Kch